MRDLLARAQRVRLTRDGGFTLVELMVSMVVIAIVVTALLTLYVATLTSTVGAKQRQSASAIATQQLERLRALPYNTVRAGLRADDLSGDPYISTGRLRINGLDERIVTSTTQAQAPLYPHRRTVIQDGQTYTVSVYVTEGTTTLPSYQLTSVVEWTVANRGSRSIVQRSTTYSSQGCLSLSNRPFSGPCQAAYTATAGITSGRITVTNASDSQQLIPGTNGSLLALDLPGLSASTAIEQTVTLSADSRTFGASSRTTSGDQSTGGVAAAASADTDPSSPTNTSSSGTTPAQTSSTLSISGLAGQLVARPSTSDSGTAAAQVSGNATGCVWSDAVPVTTSQPCAVSSVQSAGGDSTIRYDIATPLTILGGTQPATLARVSPGSTASRAASGRLISSTNGICPATAGNGCSAAAARRNLGTITLGGLPARSRSEDTFPAGFPVTGGSVMELTGFSETVLAESGAGARAPSYTRAGTLSYWNGTGFTSVNLASVTGAVTYDPPPVSASYRNGAGDRIDVVADGLLRIGALDQSQVNVLPCDKTTAAGSCTSRSTSGTALSAQVEYVVTQTVAGVSTELSRFVVIADLGSGTATTYYRGAPDA
ncbi:type IV pilus modification PilV family protein [Aquipuribacter nitratireducens]|uniref:Prepilin-type N-terminal cleavage/methylation domain-containing protein n=1 Tax=Aquipuribacter nitratireducens TaxID=650104 RepID=A0ABW0GQX0_9MICO